MLTCRPYPGQAMSTSRTLTLRTRLIRLVVSWVLVGVGVPMLVRAELGVAPFDVLNSGLNRTLGWSFGNCFIVSSVLFFALGWALGARLGWASPVGTFVIGPIVNLVLDRIGHHEALAVRVPLLLGGIAVIATAICLVVSTDLGPGPSEMFMLGLIHRGMPILPARWLSDGSPVVVGLVLGGALGVGTALFAAVMGPLVRFGLRHLGYVPRTLATSAKPTAG